LRVIALLDRLFAGMTANNETAPQGRVMYLF
jgi:hypothetical protein